MPTAGIAARLIEPVRQSGTDGLLVISTSENRAGEIGRALAALAPDLDVLVLPPWDCLPFDRASPSRESMGRRMAVLAQLYAPSQRPRALIASIDAAVQLLPPPAFAAENSLRLEVGQDFDPESFRTFAERTGYFIDERVDEAGEVAIRGEVVDIFPASAADPVRLMLNEDGTIAEILRYNAATQRTEDALEEVWIYPASELICEEGAEWERSSGIEHRLADHHEALQSVFELMPEARLVFEPGAEVRHEIVLEQIAEARASREMFRTEAGSALPRKSLYLGPNDWSGIVADHPALDVDLLGLEATPRFSAHANAKAALASFVAEQRDAGYRIVLAGLEDELRRLLGALKRRIDQPEKIEDWDDVLGAKVDAVLRSPFDLEAGFVDGETRVTVIAAADLFGARLNSEATDAGTILTEPELKVGDVVIHEDHGVGVLRALERVEVDGEERDTVRLEYHGGASLLAPVEEFGRIWRYGSEEDAVSLDRLHTDAWAKKRAEISRELDETAAHLISLARMRETEAADVLAPPRAAYAKFVARFPFPETPDQRAAFDAVFEDLASGRAMNRLVCGDVGFGKTEVALRAAAAVALAGKQVAIVAPTTVLARQHFHTFTRRFEGTGLKVAHLSRLVSAAEAKETKAGLESGDIRVVVATQALGSKDVRFADLGLLIIDEEQRFGAKLKQGLHALAPHVLTMSATPIPRTLQAAMVGVQNISIIATPPARRRPIRTFLMPFDSASVRSALLREKRRGGQSFFVVPRIADIEPISARLKEIVPELIVVVAHGELPAEDSDAVMVGFAEGEGDILLATNIIESGLDVPRANTMLVWRADRFGLSQLHQLRGRVGRGRAQGIAYLLTDPDEEIPEPTRARLSTLEAFDRLGAGLAISARDLDLRGAGDLVGEEQAGHMKLIGTALYQRLLARAVSVARGDQEPDHAPPELALEMSGSIPIDYVPEIGVRINLYARLLRMTELEEISAFAEELDDRFGELPDAVTTLLDLASLTLHGAALGLTKIAAGPKAIALSFRRPPDPRIDTALGEGFELKENRLIASIQTEAGSERLKAILKLLKTRTKVAIHLIG